MQHGETDIKIFIFNFTNMFMWIQQKNKNTYFQVNTGILEYSYIYLWLKWIDKLGIRTNDTFYHYYCVNAT